MLELLYLLSQRLPCPLMPFNETNLVTQSQLLHVLAEIGPASVSLMFFFSLVEFHLLYNLSFLDNFR